MRVVKSIEQWAVSHEQEWNSEALQTYGEKVLIRQRWQSRDFEAGLVNRCTECHDGKTKAVQDRVAAVYKQAGDSMCTHCYGVGFEGGYRPEIHVTFVLFEQQSDSDALVVTAEGESDPILVNIQLSWTPAVYNGDIVARVAKWDSTGTRAVEEIGRYRIQDVDRTILKTGPRTQQNNDEPILVSQMTRGARVQADQIELQVPLA